MPTHPATLSKTRTVLDLDDRLDDSVVFASDDTEDITTRIVTIDEATYRDLGCPQQITVTIEPGDLLNGADG